MLGLIWSATSSSGRLRADDGESALLREYEVKAGFVLNFLRFTNFPDSAHRLTLCVAGGEIPFTAFSRLEAQTVDSAKIQVRRLNGISVDEACRVLFVAGSDSDREKSLFARLSGRSVFTIGESDDFNRIGGIIRFYFEGNKIRFEVNLRTAEEAKLEISSRVLRLGRVVRQ